VGDIVEVGKRLGVKFLSESTLVVFSEKNALSTLPATNMKRLARKPKDPA